MGPPSTPQSKHKRQESNPETPPSEKVRLEGLYKEGVGWLCNCDPRYPARLFRVQKEDSPNKGQWFYRCDNRLSGRKKCNFFLWQDLARARESHLTPSDRARGEAEPVAPTPGPSRTPRMTQKSLASYGYTRQRRNSDEITDGSDSDKPVNTPSKGKRKLDVFEEDSDKESFGSFNSEDEEELVAMADEPTKNTITPAPTRMVDGLPTPLTTRTLFPGATEGRSEKRHKTMAFDDLPETPSKQPSGTSSSGTATIQALSPPTTTKTVTFSSPINENPPADPIDSIMAILQPYSLSTSDTTAVRDLLTVEARKKVGVEKSRDFKQRRCEEKDLTIAKLQEEVAALKNKERMQHSQITEMKAKSMRLFQDFGNN